MTITIKCDNCGNSVEVKILHKKYLQFRDELNVKGFHFDIQEPKGEEVILRCHKCNNWITLGLN